MNRTDEELTELNIKNAKLYNDAVERYEGSPEHIKYMRSKITSKTDAEIKVAKDELVKSKVFQNLIYASDKMKRTVKFTKIDAVVKNGVFKYDKETEKAVLVPTAAISGGI